MLNSCKLVTEFLFSIFFNAFLKKWPFCSLHIHNSTNNLKNLKIENRILISKIEFSYQKSNLKIENRKLMASCVLFSNVGSALVSNPCILQISLE